jgi:hypothetical protein
MRVVGLACLVLALGFLAAAKGRYTVQPVDERGPLSRTVAYVALGLLFALAAFAPIRGER